MPKPKCECNIENNDGDAIYFQHGRCSYCLNQKKIAGELLSVVQGLVSRTDMPGRVLQQLVESAREAGIGGDDVPVRT